LLAAVVVLGKQVMVDTVEEMDLVDLDLVVMEHLPLVLVERKVEVEEQVVDLDQILQVQEDILVLLDTMLSIVIMVEILVVLEHIRANVVAVVVLDTMAAVAVVDLMELTALVVEAAAGQESSQVPGQVHHLRMV